MRSSLLGSSLEGTHVVPAALRHEELNTPIHWLTLFVCLFVLIRMGAGELVLTFALQLLPIIPLLLHVPLSLSLFSPRLFFLTGGL